MASAAEVDADVDAEVEGPEEEEDAAAAASVDAEASPAVEEGFIRGLCEGSRRVGLGFGLVGLIRTRALASREREGRREDEAELN